MAKDDGGPAFPGNEQKDDGAHFYSHNGMSLRDWFAGQALTGLISKFSWPTPRDAAEVAYNLADAMLKERARVED